MSSSTSPFLIREHTFEGQHIREYPAALAHSQEDVVKLHAKSYTPHEVASGAVKGQLTIIGFHANAFHKEVYEPFLEQLYHRLKDKHGLTIGSIWFADQSNQGQSAVINNEVLGNDAHWFDHSRDILQMVNTFRSEMKRPITALGHSMGGTQAVATAHFHPRLFESVVLMDPPMTMKVAKTMPAMIRFGMSKPESFASREEAERFVHKNPLFKGWDPAVVQRYLATAFHEGPTALFSEPGRIQPTTTKHQEVRTLARPNLSHVAVAGPVDEAQRYTHPDVNKASPFTGPFYNPHPRQGYSFLGTLRPPTLFVLGKGSGMCSADEIEHRTAFTGSRVGGSGGVKVGNVESVTVHGGHFLPMTNPAGTAEAAAGFLARRIEIWREAEEKFLKQWKERSTAEKQALHPEEVKVIRTWDGKAWRNPHAEPDGGRSRL